MPESKWPLISVDEARARIREHVCRLPVEEIRFDDAQGRVLANDVHAPDPLPPFPASSKDGFAVIADDDTTWRQIVGDQFAGYDADLRVERGTAARVTTGAPIPAGADAVVMVEYSETKNGRVHFTRSVEPGADIRPVGQAIAEGQLVLEAGTRLGPPELGILATVGATRVNVYRTPQIGVMSTGDEIVEPDEQPGPGQIRDSNRFSLMGAVRDAGAEVHDMGLAPDVAGELEAFIRKGLERYDAIVTSGGVSMGELDLVKPLLDELGTVHFGRVATKPGKPVTFATVDGKPFFAMPGFPVSSLVSFEVYARPALLHMAGLGWDDTERPRVPVVLDHYVAHTAARTEFQRAVIRFEREDGCFHAVTTGFQGSGRLLSMVGANGLIVLPQGQHDFEQNEVVEAMLIGPLVTPA